MSRVRGWTLAAAPSLVAILLALLLGMILVSALGESPVEVATVLVTGVFGNGEGFGAVLYNMTALLLTGLSVAFAFRAGLFNIGAEGQLTMGAFCSALMALSWTSAPAFVLLPLCLLAAALGGGVWGAIPGFLRAKLGVHEVINTIMMNFIASGLTGYFTVVHLREPGQMSPHTSEIPRAAWLPSLGEVFGDAVVPSTSPANATLLIALVVAAIVAWLIARTPFGFQVRSVGASEVAARTAGIPTQRTLILTMAVAGALAGLAGVNDVLGERHRFLDNFSSGIGFLGIAVALLGRAHVGGVVAASFLFGVLSAGALEVDLFTDVPREIILVVQAAILLFVVAADEVFRRLLRSSLATGAS